MNAGVSKHQPERAGSDTEPFNLFAAPAHPNETICQKKGHIRAQPGADLPQHSRVQSKPPERVYTHENSRGIGAAAAQTAAQRNPFVKAYTRRQGTLRNSLQSTERTERQVGFRVSRKGGEFNTGFWDQLKRGFIRTIKRNLICQGKRNNDGIQRMKPVWAGVKHAECEIDFGWSMKNHGAVLYILYSKYASFVPSR